MSLLIDIFNNTIVTKLNILLQDLILRQKRKLYVAVSDILADKIRCLGTFI